MSAPLGDGSGCWDQATSRFVAGIDPQDRYGAEWARRAQARLFDVDRRCREWAECIPLLTATASTSWPGEDTPIPPAVHFQRGLRASREARHKALERALSGCRWRAVRVYGVGSDEHVHRHTGVYVAREVSRSALEPWASAHRNNSPLAQGNPGDGSVRVDNGPDIDHDGDISCIGADLMRNIPGCDTRGERDHGIQSAPTNIQRGAAVLDLLGADPITVGPLVSPASGDGDL